MNSEEYKNMISSKHVLDYSTLNITLKEVFSAEKNSLVSEIERILAKNKIEKPSNHVKENDQTTHYYIIDLGFEDIDEIADIFYDLEVKYIGENGETTPTSAFYAVLADKWAALNS